MSSQRNHTVDILRLVSAFGVTLIHLSPSTVGAERVSHTFLLFVVPYFLLLALHFSLGKYTANPTAGLSDSGFDRILLPYLSWTLIYIILHAIKSALTSRAFEVDFAGALFFGGAAVHLYFIPLLVAFQTLALATLWIVRKPRRLGRGLFLAGLSLGFCGVGSSLGYFGFQDAPWKAVVYIALSCLMIKMQADHRGRLVNRVFGFCVVADLATRLFIDLPFAIPDSIMGYGMCAFALNLPIHIEKPAVKTILSCSFGIYLAHFGVLEALEFLAVRTGLVLTPYSLFGEILIGLIITAICVGLVGIARCNRRSAYLLLGEKSS